MKLKDTDKLIELIDDDIAAHKAGYFEDFELPPTAYGSLCALRMVREYIKALPTIEAVPLEDYRSMEQTVYKLTQALAEAETVNNGRKPKVVTNADNLRSIQNDMQLAIFMGSVNACPYDRDDALFECEKWNGACDRCWLYWLKQKVEDEVEDPYSADQTWAEYTLKK